MVLDYRGSGFWIVDAQSQTNCFIASVTFIIRSRVACSGSFTTVPCADALTGGGVDSSTDVRLLEVDQAAHATNMVSLHHRSDADADPCDLKHAQYLAITSRPDYAQARSATLCLFAVPRRNTDPAISSMMVELLDEDSHTRKSENNLAMYDVSGAKTLEEIGLDNVGLERNKQLA